MPLTERQRAKNLLKLKDQGFKSPWTYLLKSKILVIATVLLTFAAISTILTPSEDIALERFIWICSGILIGRILRDLVWLKDGAAAFPFLSKVLDWKKVEDLSKDESSATPPTLPKGQPKD